MGRISLWPAKHPRSHELMLDRAIKLANTANNLNFLVRIHCGWAGPSLPFKSSHLCIFTVWINDTFKNKTRFTPRKTQSLKWWVTNSTKESAVLGHSYFFFLTEGFMFSVGRHTCLHILMRSQVQCHWTWESRACKVVESS